MQTAWTAAGTESVMVGFVSVEATSFATSYIPTTTVAVTRNADSLTGPLANLIGSAGTVRAEVDLFNKRIIAGANRAILGSSGVTASGRALFLLTGADTWNSYDGTTFIASPSQDLTIAHKAASAWGGSTILVTSGGKAPLSGAFDGDMGFVTAVEIAGYGGGNSLDGAIRNLMGFSRKLDSSQVRALSA